MKNKPFASCSQLKGLICAVAASLVLACGGGGEDPSSTASSASTASDNGRKKANAVFVPSNIPADAHTRGMWSPVYQWPLIPLHLVMIPDGRLMSYGTDGAGTQTGNFIYDIWDPEGGLSGGHMTLPNGTGTDLFCSSQLVLPDGSAVFIAGGDNWTGTGTTNTGNNNSNLFSVSGNSLTRTNNMNRARWYSSSTTLLNGETYIQGGASGTDRPEVRQADGSFRLLSGADTGTLDYWYPRNFIAPDGRVFGFDSNGVMYYVNPIGTGSITMMGQFNSAYTGNDSSAAMFRPGRILQFGGNSNSAAVIDIRGPSPTFTPTQSMSSQRRLVTGTILADGKVLATGGSRVWNELIDVNNIAEIWNPDSGGWTQGASGRQARLYHSVAMLMADASVLVGGGGAPGPQNNRNIEIYFPPYLFSSGGVLAARPSITSAPTVLNIGKTFKLQVAGSTPVTRVVMVKSGSVTHSWNMEQRFVELTFAANGSELSVQGPTRAADAPPGFYMVFVLNSAGVPSVAKMVRMNVAATPNPLITPTLVNPGNQASVVGTSVNLQLQASDPNGDVLRYGATGLPPGLSLNAGTGAISGRPTSTGSFNVAVTASDGVNTASAGFTWTVTGAPALVVTLPVSPQATQAGSTVTFTASSNGINPRYKWNFGDGSAQTTYSSSPSASHSYSAPGLYYVTLTAIDDRGVEQRVTVLHTVRLPLSAQQPSASTNIAIEPRSGVNPRLWVVNQDNDSVSVFDAITRAKLAEIAVGVAPRTVAVAPNGMVWVANKKSATISVIDPAVLAIKRTISLPRASQPFGIAISAADGGFALVALEATGQVLKFSTGTYAQTGSAAVPGNPRHVAISSNGATAFVSRFVSAPLAGEATAAVNTASGGAEVLRIATGTMTMLGATVLAHSNKPDAENQGSGLPNYLGAAVISPDASQAWVPSKQDNIARGMLRKGSPLNFQNTVRAISSRIHLATNQEDLGARIDHDNASVASAAAFDPNGIYLFVALETSRQVAVVDAHGRREVMRFDVGRAPQGLVVSADGNTLFVSNFMDRSVGVFDLRPLRNQGLASVPAIATLNSVASERLSATVLRGKQFFYDARDTRLAREAYMSCATCHNDGGHDGRVWDFTGFGEGLRNTISLRGRSGAQGFLHWSNNFDEVQDFEGQIRALAGGTGLMSDAQFNTGTRSQPLGTPKAGVSADLDAMAAYVASLNAFDASPYRTSTGSLSATGAAGKALFTTLNCASCHAGSGYTNSGANTLSNIGTIKAGSGQRLGGSLAGIDVPTLRDVWATAPYLHDGSAPSLEAAVAAHNNVSVAAADLAKLAAYLREIGAEAGAAPSPTGTGLNGSYFNNIALSGSAVLSRIEAVNFDWGRASPGPGVNADNFSARWSGVLAPPTTGSYQFSTYSDDGVRVQVNGVQVINNWTDHPPTTDTSASISLVAGQRYNIVVEYYERSATAVMQLRWRLPGSTTFNAVPAANLYPN